MPTPVEQLVADAADHAGGARQIRAAARLMTLLENEPQRLPELFRHRPQDAWPQPRLVLGVTGAPGSGKSTLTDQLVSAYRQRDAGRRVGVIAVDPSSPFTGGSVLGDRVRMMRHATDPHVFIRSLASRGHLGGLSLGVKGVLRVLGLLGCDVVFIETVGVGQSEVEVAGVADLVAVVLAPGQGDAVQMLKAGLMEIGDLFVVNKADRDGAAALHSQLLAALSLGRWEDHDLQAHPAAGHTDAPLAEAALDRRRSGQPDVYLVSAEAGTGLPELVEGLERYAAEGHARWQARREAAVHDEVRAAVFEAARRRLSEALGRNGTGTEQIERVLRGEVSVEALTRELMQRAGRTPS